MRRLDTTRRGLHYRTFRDIVSQHVFGQDEAVEVVARAYQTYRMGLHRPRRPVSNLLFLGPTGVGKTRLVEATARFLHDNDTSFVKVDCGEYQHGHEIAKLIGSPPGYLGHRETRAALAQDNVTPDGVDAPYIVLFDEIEKAHDALWQLLLGILDKGTLTLGDNRRVDFSDVMVFMTGNLGTADIAAARTPPGFASGPAVLSSERRAGIVTSAAKRRFSPEFMNRLDHVVTFNDLTPENVRAIVIAELADVQQRMLRACTQIALRATSAAIDALARRGVSTEYGARHLKRLVETEIVLPLTDIVASNQVADGDIVRIGHSAGSFTFAAYDVADADDNDAEGVGVAA